jgi:ribosomal protein S6--L-glutamate ligase
MVKNKPYILLVTSRPDGWPSRRLRDSARKLRFSLKTINPSNVSLEIDSGEFRLRNMTRLFPMPNVVIPRLGPGNYETGLPLVRQFESAGIPVINSADSIALARETFSTLQILAKNGINTPRTAYLLSMKDLKNIRKFIPGPPWIVKTFTGAMGIGTMRADAVDQLEAISATIWATRNPILVQEFLETGSNAHSDTRAFVINGKVVASMTRTAKKGEFRANVHMGGASESKKLSMDEKSIAVKAALAVGLDVAGVDWIESNGKKYVLEVNATPGFQGLEEATGVDIGRKIISFASKLGKL